jgi:hypothetical protein
LHIEEVWAFGPWSAIETRLDKQIAEFKSAIEEYSAQIGFDLDRVRDRHEHYAWLALFQCKGMSPEKIREWNWKPDQPKLVPSTISHAVRKIAKKIGLDLRPGQRGHARRG